jgi:diguanylate cyclase (GGDEF)-like protein
VREFVFIADETSTHITVSAGVATYPSGPSIDSVDGLLRAADVALYRAKDAGRDRVVFDEGAAQAGAPDR